ncbi:uncharacterized protein LOC120850114 [Ixodes scapularis]|uniref:uncharacterized protein LOC120850114 n=1 Tax=Ixodes scapularis TaxID=6945 RepID=UPI001C394E06|nr:uncharacterized protein LOC120850114 [Ixodes scapularis]
MSGSPDVESGSVTPELVPQPEKKVELDVGGEEEPGEEVAGDDGGPSVGVAGSTVDKIQFRKAMDSIMVARTGRGPAAVKAGQDAAEAQKKMLITAVVIVGILILILALGAFVIIKIAGDAETTTQEVGRRRRSLLKALGKDENFDIFRGDYLDDRSSEQISAAGVDSQLPAMDIFRRK